MLMLVGTGFVAGLLVLATILVLIDLRRLRRQAQARKRFEAVVAKHAPSLSALTLPEAADDYIESLVGSDNNLQPTLDPLAPHMGPWRRYKRPPTRIAYRTRG